MTYEERQQSRKEAEDLERKAEKLKLLKTIGSVLLGVAVSISAVWSVIALDRVNDGNFGIGKSISGIYQDATINQGLSFNFLTQVFEVDGKNNIVQISDVRPKDKNGVLLEDVDYNVTYNVNPEKAVEFIREHRDVSLSNDGTYVLGQVYVKKSAQRIATEVIREFASVELLDSPIVVEEAIRKALQTDLDAKFGVNLFDVSNVNFSRVKMSAVIENQIANSAVAAAEGSLAAAKLKSLEQRAITEEAEAKKLAKTAEASGLSIGQLLELRRIAAIANLHGNGKVVVSLDPAKTPGSP